MPTTDPRWTPPAHLSALDRWFLTLVRDERDLIFPQTAFEITTRVVPLGLLMIALPTTWMIALWIPYIAYVFTQYTGRYQLMCHALMHRPTYKKEASWVQTWTFWGLSAFFGSTPTSFAAHHIGMHHPENNLEADLSCTLMYKRDEFTHFLHYWARFFFPGLFHLARYLRLRGRAKLARSLLIGEVSWVVGVGVLAAFDLGAAIGVFVLPLVMMRWLMMAGNFAQHAFVDIDDPNNAYRNSTNLTNTRYNHKCFNDGYHIVHHLKANLHWSEMAQWYDDHKEEHAAQDAIVWDGLGDNQQIWFLLMTKNYDKLANHMVNFKNRTHEEKVAFLKERVQRHRGVRRGLFELDPAPTPA